MTNEVWYFVHNISCFILSVLSITLQLFQTHCDFATPLQ